MAMAVRQARRQLQFTGFEMALIAVSFLVTVTTVFFLGLFVGKTNASYHAPTEDRVARIPVDDFTRYKRPEPIAKPAKEPKAAPADSEIVAASSAKVPVAPAGSTAEVKTASVPAEPVGPAPVAEPAAKAAVPVAPAVAPVDPKAKDTAAKEAAAKEAAAAKAAAEKKEEEKAEPESTGRGYTVQILATRKSADADALAKKLKSRGLAAYIKKVGDGEGTWYRVRVGSYGAFSEAKGMADKVRRDLGLGQAFVSTE